MLCLTISKRVISVTLAYLLAIYSTDISVHIIDIAGIALPRQIGGLSLLTCIPVFIILVLAPQFKARAWRLLRPVDSLLLGTFILWGAIEWKVGLSGGKANYSMILASLQPYLVYLIVFMHQRVFGSRQVLVDAFVITVGLLSFVHLVLLLLLQGNVPLPYLVPGEILSRNSISLMLVMAVFVALFFDNINRDHISLRAVIVTLIAIAHIHLNSARAGGILLISVILVRIYLWYFQSRQTLAWLLLVTTLGAMIATTFSFDVLSALKVVEPAALNSNDDSLSTFFRTYSNAKLLGFFIHTDPIFGVGLDQVMSVRAGPYISHTLYLIYLAAYGIVGMLPLVVILWNLFYQFRSSDGVTLDVAIFLILFCWCFVNDPLPCFGFLPALALIKRTNDS